MRKRIVILLAAAMFFVMAAVNVAAQDVVMNSAETINQGNFKLAIFPTVLFGKNGGDSLTGVAGRFGYGFTSRFDVEAVAATFKGLSYFGVAAEYWLIQGRNANVSVALGGHLTNRGGGADSSGIDTTLLFSTSPVDRLELYGGLKFAFDKFKNSNNSYTMAHIVPGIEYRLSADLDFLAEVGIALNDNSRSYASVGFAFYIR